MKCFNKIIYGFAFTSLISCNYLDKEPFDIVTPDQVCDEFDNNVR